jgi:hypothetical protein
MPAKKEPLFMCQECKKEFYTVKAAERASFGDGGCPGCGGSDIDVYVGGKGKSIGRFGGKGGFRVLSEEETKAFRKWARDNYVISTPINNVWHPIVKEECHKMNRDYGTTIGRFGGSVLRIPVHKNNPGKGAGIRKAKLNDKKATWAKKGK